MNVSIGTFNLNNLFSRYNFKDEMEAIKDEKTAIEAEYVLKNNFVDYRDDPAESARKNNRRRQRQAEVMAEIVLKRTRPNSRFAILGDMNDAPDSSYLAPLTSSAGLDLTNALTDPKETRPTKESKYPAPGPAWTHRYKPKGGDMQYELYDQIWLSPSLAKRQTGAWIHRRKNLTGDGSDHDPAWVELSL
ncbi:MAG: endonuclease/exonuclease/phosphatase family protein [Desulfobacterales bacterium]|jgi:exonuclease III